MTIITVTVCVASAWPLIVIAIVAHELGHAAVVLAKSATVVTIRIGSPTAARQLQIGRLRMIVSRHGLAGVCHFPRDVLSRIGHVQSLLAGPALNLTIGAALLLPAELLRPPLDALFFTAAVINLVTGFGELFPYRSRGQVNRGLASDGLQVWWYLRGRPISPRPAGGTANENQAITSVAVAGKPRPIVQSSVPPPSWSPPSSD